MLDTSPAATNLARQDTPYKKKLIEVALPLHAINAASAREKSIRHGHPSTLHLWWARRPLAACRAVLFASLVDDPSSDPESFPTVEDQQRKRKELFDLIEELVQWENSLNDRVLERARAEIRRCVGDELPTIYDPFCGGGAIPIEAQRLGLPTLASDLNPVAALITKALTEIPWRFKGCAPVHPSLRGPLQQRTWERATGLASDVEAYGAWMVKEARERIGRYYPPVKLSNGREVAVIAWLWTRTVRCKNPVCGADMPLVKSFALSSKRGGEWCVEPIVDREHKIVRFETRAGAPSQEGTVDRRGARCIVCGESVSLAYVRSEGRAGRIGARMLAIVGQGERGRIYVPPDESHEMLAFTAFPPWAPDTDLPKRALGFRVQAYGMTKHRNLFTPRQLLALTTFSDLAIELHKRVLADAIDAGLVDDGASLESGGSGASAYADAIATYIAMVVDRMADYCSSLCRWVAPVVGDVFGRQTISMIWDYAESNAVGNATGGLGSAINWVKKAIECASAGADSAVFVSDASSARFPKAIVATDPPYYDNVPYADLSDFFYVWLRHSLYSSYPDTLATLLVPKAEELVADPSRFDNDRTRARAFFERGLAMAFSSAKAANKDFPTTIFYAFKQTEAARTPDAFGGRGGASIGWEAMISALLDGGFQITGTWPLTSERSVRPRSIDSNALASSIVLVCRPRDAHAQACSRADFIGELKRELPVSIRRLRNASLAATDLQQASLGPGMAIFSKYSEVLEPDDSKMSVGSALGLINEELAQIMLGDIADVDAATHFSLAWFERHGYGSGSYGDADVLLKAKNAGLDSLSSSGVAVSGKGHVALVSPHAIARRDLAELQLYPVWAQLMHLLSALIGEDGSEQKASAALRALGREAADRVKSVAYHCYLICDGTKRLQEAGDFNALVTAWPDLQRLAAAPDEDRLL